MAAETPNPTHKILLVKMKCERVKWGKKNGVWNGKGNEMEKGMRNEMEEMK